MPQPIADPFSLTVAELQRLLLPGTSHLLELEAARRDLAALRDAPQTQIVLAETEPLLAKIEQIPVTTYTQYRTFLRSGDRTSYETPYFLRRSNLTAVAMRLFLGQTELKELVQDYLWAICEETNWVLPAHENDPIDLFAAETGFLLAELLMVLGDTLDAEVRSRVRLEIERRIFEPYLHFHRRAIWWYQGRLNWNGVCNSSIAATFLLLEPEPGRAAHALAVALAGLRVYLETAFEEDGSSTEGVFYWYYGLLNFVALAEMLRARTAGAIDLLDSPHIRNIAAFPAKMLLPDRSFIPFSDCDETIHFEPGIIARLAERTGEPSLWQLLTPPALREGHRWFPMHLRNILWWEGRYQTPGPVDDAYLPLGGMVRLTARTPQGRPVVVALKAGHNDENHNHNDIGSFILHVDGETLLTDAGKGLYTRQYFGPERYENIFANAYGHGVPRIGGHLQPEGREFYGEFVNVDLTGPTKQTELDFSHAYPVTQLSSARRRLTLEQTGGAWLHDTFSFADDPLEVEEAFITWLEVEVDGPTAVIHGQRYTLQMSIEAPAGLHFDLEPLTAQCQANAKPGLLKRLTVRLPVVSEPQFCMRLEVVEKQSPDAKASG